MLGPIISVEWDHYLRDQINTPEFQELMELIDDTYPSNEIYPKRQDLFRAFQLTRPSDVGVVILGQDPYHQPNQADGLAFSVPKEQPIPPSLKNIFKELVSDMSISQPSHGNLDHWASQGVLLLNSILTVKEGDPLANQDMGWEKFTNGVIRKLGHQDQPIVFVLWGKHAQSKHIYIKEKKHLVLMAPHPSPLSSYRGFFGSKPFSKINTQLRQWGKKEIQW